MKFPLMITINAKLPDERQAVTIALLLLIVGLLVMAVDDPLLWNVDLYKVLLQGAIMTGFIGLVLSFHYSANQADAAKTANTAKAFEALTAVAQAAAPPTTTTVTTTTAKADQTAPVEADAPTGTAADPITVKSSDADPVIVKDAKPKGTP